MKQRPTLKPTPQNPEPLTAPIIADMAPGEERGDAQVPGLRVRFIPLFGSKPASELTRRELQDGLIRPTLLKHPRKATQLLSRIRCADLHAVEQGRHG